MLFSSLYDGIGPMENTRGLNRILTIDLSLLKNQIKEKKSDLSADEKFSLENLQPTTNGKYSSIYYTFILESNFSGPCQSAPQVIIPIIVVPTPLPSFNDIKEPSDWQPQRFGSFNCKVGPTGIKMVNSPEGRASVEREMSEETKRLTFEV